MRLIRSLRMYEEDRSASSSVRSVDSYEVFGSAYSDLSECEVHCDERKRPRRSRNNSKHYTSPPESGGNSYRSAMDYPESAPLLPAVNVVPVLYNAIPSPSDSLGSGSLSSNEILYTYMKHTEIPQKPERKRLSSLVTIFSIWNTILGSSLLTVAWGVERAGLPAALILMTFMSAICLYTAYVLLKVNYHHGSDTCEVPGLCRVLLGPVYEKIAHMFSLIVLVGANIVYWILITNFLFFTVNYFIDLTSPNTTKNDSTLLCPKHAINGSLLLPSVNDDSPYWGLHTTAPMFVAIIVSPLLLFRNVSFFTKFNSLGTLSVIYLLIFVVVKGFIWGINIDSLPLQPAAASHAAVLSGMLAMSFYIHNIIITIMSNNKRQENNGRDLTIAFLLVTITYTVLGVVFYICFPLAKSCIEDNILNNFEIHDVMTALARMLLLFQVITVFPLTAYLLRTEAILLLPIPEHIKDNWWLTMFANCCIVIMCILMACLCPSIGTVIRYTGAMSGLVFIFALPSMLMMRSLQLRGKLTFWKIAFYCFIILFGTVNMFMQFFIAE